MVLSFFWINILFCIKERIMNYILTTDNLSKRYRNTLAVDGLSIHIKEGSIYGFIGRNGAGKTTTLKMISGLSSPTSGDFTLYGKNRSDAAQEHLFSKVGILIEDPGLYTDMSAFANLKMKCICAGINDDNYIKGLLELVGLADVGKKATRYFSMGMKKRLGIAMALIGEPSLLILDEPVNGLDPQGIYEVRETILKLNHERNITIIISSHILEELSKIATDYGIINEGKLVAELTSEELNAKLESRIVIRLSDTNSACRVLDSMGITRYAVVAPDTIHVSERLDESAVIGMALAKADILVSAIYVEQATLEGFFFNLTGGVNND